MSERLSSLVDGELDDAASGTLLEQLIQDEALRATWGRYHLIGDALRSHLSPVLNEDLAARVRRSLDGEPTVLRPSARRLGKSLKHLAGFGLAASVAVVAVVGVRSISDQGPKVGPEQIAMQERDEGPTAETLAIDEKLNRYLVNHSGYAGSGMQGMLPYARIVGYHAGR